MELVEELKEAEAGAAAAEENRPSEAEDRRRSVSAISEAREAEDIGSVKWSG